jgi:uncharacterized protein YfaP (DUF2135 family)
MSSIRRVAAMAIVVALTGCSGPEPEPYDPGPMIGGYVTEVQVLDRRAAIQIRPDQLPPGDAAGPAVRPPKPASVVNGGSLLEAVAASGAFTRLRVGLEPVNEGGPSAGVGAGGGPSAGVGAGTPAPGYYEISLTEATPEARVVLTVAPAVPGTSLVLHYAAVAADGTQGRAVRQRVQVLSVGTGQVQISVSWDADSDIDLHVVDPFNDEVYFEQPEVDSGGRLDLDSNAECAIDHKRNENITWPTAPPGPYVVRLDYWSNCGVARTRYVVTVRIDGQPPRVFDGEFTGSGDDGGLGSGREITTFTVTAATPTG